MADGVEDIDLFSWWLLDFFSSGNTNRIPNPYWCDHVMSRSTVMSRSYWKPHSQHLNLDLAIFFTCMCNCKQFFQVSTLHYNRIHLVQKGIALHVNYVAVYNWVNRIYKQGTSFAWVYTCVSFLKLHRLNKNRKTLTHFFCKQHFILYKLWWWNMVMKHEWFSSIKF